MFDQMCRFCMVEDQELHKLSENSLISQFYEILPIKLILFEERLPQVICTVCNSKVNESVEFFERIAESDRQLRDKLCLPSADSGIPKSKDDLVTEILSNIKTKGSISIAKISVIPHEKLIKCQPSQLFCETTLSASDADENENHDGNSCQSDSDDSDADYDESLPRKKTTPKGRKGRSVVEIIEPKYVCARCRGKFNTVDDLNYHLDNSTSCNDKNVKCEPCDKVFSTRRLYQKHFNGVHRKKVIFNICDRCKRKFTTPTDLEKHSGICTGDFGEERSGILFKCRECHKTFDKKVDLMQHVQNHPSTLLCETCGKACETRKQYNQHKSKHLNLKPFGCDLCDKRFATRTLLLAHQHVHTGIKRYVCDTCGKSFAKKSSLTVHIRVHTGERPYECRECMDKFATLDRLKNHIKKHQENNCYVY